MTFFPEIERLGCPRSDFDGVIFDFDGTLADSMFVWNDIDRRFCEKYGLVLPDDYDESIVGLGFEGTAQYFIDELGLKMSLQACCDEFNELALQGYRDEVALKPGARTYLDVLQARDMPLAIASSLNMKLLGAALDHNGVRDRFRSFSLCDDLHTHKNESKIYLAAAASIDVDPARCLVFEDIVPAIRSAKRAGMTAVAVYDEHDSQNTPTIRQTADGFIRDFTMLN